MKNRKKETEINYDEALLQQISVIGNLKHYETYSRTGTGYEACIHICDFPAALNDFWITDVCNFPNTVTSVSVQTMDQIEVKKNLNEKPNPPAMLGRME